MRPLQTFAIIATILLSLADTALAQRPGTPQAAPDVQDLAIRVVLPGGRSGPPGLLVQLFNGVGIPLGNKVTDPSGQTHFANLTEGDYQVLVSGDAIEVTSYSFRLYHRESSSLQIVSVKPKLSTSGAPHAPIPVPVIDLKVPRKAQKQFKRGTDALAKRNWGEARKRLEKAVELYPDYVAAYNNLGVALMNSGETEKGRAAFEKTVDINSNYAPGYVNLAHIAASAGQYQQAQEYLKKSTRLDPGNVEALALLAQAELMNRHYEDAIRDARAVHSLPHHNYPEVHYICALALQAMQRTAEAADEYRAFLKEHPEGTEAEQARKLLQSLEQHRRSTSAARSGPQGLLSSAAVVPAAEIPLATRPNWEVIPKAAAKPNLPRSAFSQAWAPPDVDQVIPPVRPGVQCPLHEVRKGASSRAKELMDNLQRFSATERIEQVRVDKAGKPRQATSATVQYVAEIRKARTGGLTVEEYRDGSLANNVSLEAVAATGMPAHALIFSPSLIDDFIITCEGLGSVHGTPAWQLHFMQSPTRPSRFRSYIHSKGAFPVGVKGRAWVAVGSYQVMRMETDLEQPIKEIGLLKDHMTTDYVPVEFAKRKVQLWLPQTTDLYVDLAGQRFHRRHSLSDFELFSVDVTEKTRIPEVP
jgi:tetratricopeptide (TPR) repeat protein